jgi:hypothetical protein
VIALWAACRANTVLNTVTSNTVFEHCVRSTGENTSSIPCCAEAHINLSLDIYCAGFSCRWAYLAQSALPAPCCRSPDSGHSAVLTVRAAIHCERKINHWRIHEILTTQPCVVRPPSKASRQPRPCIVTGCRESTLSS